MRDVNAIAFQVRGEVYNFGQPPVVSYEDCFGEYPDADAVKAIHDSYAQFNFTSRFVLTANNPTGSDLSIYKEANDLNSVMDSVQNGTVVNLLERKALITNGRVMGWYRIEYDFGKTGWVYGPNLKTAWQQLPTPTPKAQVCAGSLPPRLVIGKKAYITVGKANRLRSSPTGAIIDTIPGGMEIKVIGGPICGVENLTFWRVDYNGKQGWTAEGDNDGYWIEPLG